MGGCVPGIPGGVDASALDAPRGALAVRCRRRGLGALSTRSVQSAVGELLYTCKHVQPVVTYLGHRSLSRIHVKDRF